MYKDHLHDVKIIHISTWPPPPTATPWSRRKASPEAQTAKRGAAGEQGEWGNGQYLTKARKLDTECFSSEPDVEARPVLRRLRSYPRVRGQCVGAFAECSSDIHLLLRETARSAAMRY